jgi:phage-related protein
MGDSRKRLQAFPASVRGDAGRNLLRIQQGKAPADSKTLPDVGSGIQELRVWDESGTYRVVFVAKFAGTVYVLHAFQKKTQTTSSRDLNLVRKRYEEVRESRKRV